LIADLACTVSSLKGVGDLGAGIQRVKVRCECVFDFNDTLLWPRDRLPSHASHAHNIGWRRSWTMCAG
jgi:hypothetical protein